VTRDSLTAPRWRLFFAAPLSNAAADSLWSALAPLRDRHPNARWARRAQLHITLAFLGQTDPDELPRLTEAAALTARQHAPFDVVTDGAGGRADDRRGGVAWLRVEEPTRRFDGLARELDWRVGTNLYSRGRPRPHVTVARRIDGALLADLHDTAESLRTSWVLDRIVLYRSHPDPGGSRYEALGSSRLGRLEPNTGDDRDK